MNYDTDDPKYTAIQMMAQNGDDVRKHSTSSPLPVLRKKLSSACWVGKLKLREESQFSWGPKLKFSLYFQTQT